MLKDASFERQAAEKYKYCIFSHLSFYLILTSNYVLLEEYKECKVLYGKQISELYLPRSLGPACEYQTHTEKGWCSFKVREYTEDKQEPNYTDIFHKACEFLAF
jgi:hypothetical protein